MKILGIDIGGSAVKGAPVDTRTGKLLKERHRIATPKILKPEDLAKVVAELVAHFKWTGPIGCGFPGVVRHGRVSFVGNLHEDFVGCDVATLFAKATGRNVTDWSVINDADAAGLAEIHFGAGKGVKGTVLMLTFGTGVGSGLFVDGILYPNSEFGQLKFKGKRAELTVSAAAKERKKWSYKKWSHHVDDYLKQVEGVLRPELIVIGGGISEDHEKWFKHVKIDAPMVPAKFFNEAGIVGAALSALK